MVDANELVVELTFPLPRPWTGVPVGNGVQGLMVWGDQTLNVTVARAGFWDHRGAALFESQVTYRQLRRWIEAGDEQAIRRAFEGPPRPEGVPAHPYQIGGGRLELSFPDGLVPQRALVDLRTGTLRVDLANEAGRCETVLVRQAVDEEVAWVVVGEPLTAAVRVALVPSYRFTGERLAKLGVEPPTVQGPTDSPGDAPEGGMLQRLPEDPALAIAWRRGRDGITLATALGDSPEDDPTAQARARLDADRHVLLERAAGWWGRFWDTVPHLDLPDPLLIRMYRYGLWRLAGCTMAVHPHAPPAGLQGPFMEETKLPDWSNDYHFNINVQMMYWPLLHTGLTEHLGPMWRMLRGWLERMRERGEAFFEARGALMLPHATDDRCQVVGSFWTGTIDHGCCAWMAQLAWLDYRHGGDERVLREVAWPLLVGAFEGYWAMAQRIADPAGIERLSLPVSVSPEYNGSRMDAVGRDASFQLAAWHMVSATLPQAAAVLGEPLDPRWEEARLRVPPYAPVPLEAGSATSGVGWHVLEGSRPGTARIGLWEGQDLQESHRHHAHLAGIYPFGTIDPFDPAHESTVAASYLHWTLTGAGAWTSWALPWASTLCARRGYAQAAVAWLHWMAAAFENEGHQAPHSGARGATAVCFGSAEAARQRFHAGGPDNECVQLDGVLGCVTAIGELLVQCRPDAIHVLPELPMGWRRLRFDRVVAEGGFRIGATVHRGRRTQVRITSPRGGRLRLAHHLGPRYLLDGRECAGDVLEANTRPGQTLVLDAVE